MRTNARKNTSSLKSKGRALALALFLLFGLAACATTDIEVRGQYDAAFGKVKRP